MAQAPRVRFAPSPTGYLHVGGARTALFNWLYAKQTGGVFVLRIEDTDRERSTGESTATILDGMAWLGLSWDEGPVHQADGLERHRADAARMLADGSAYRCFCTPLVLQAKRDAMKDEYRYDRTCYGVPADESARRAAAGEPFTVRFRVPGGATEWDDVVHGPTRFANESIEDFIVLRTDGTPIYNLAVVSDDIDMRITHVIRGDDHISNTPKQILLYQALGAGVPTFAHLPMILGPDGRKLSKRRNAVAVGDYAGSGILPAALVNFLALLGWNPGDEQEVMTLDELVQRFSLERINKKGAVFDTGKLEWMNGQHLARTPSADLLPLVAPLLVGAGLLTEADVDARRDWLLWLLDLTKVRARTVPEIAEQARVFLADPAGYDPEVAAKQWKDREQAASVLDAVAARLRTVQPWEPAGIEAGLREAAEAAGLGFGKVVHPLRLALTGGGASPGIDQVVALLGREVTLRRIEAAKAWLAAGA
ncbi:MAG: gltX2 [Gemmatimonadetes bacterium]|nr:gltX2 [Gemmatimonadota bacterium]